MKKFYMLFIVLSIYGGLFAQPHIQGIEDATGNNFVQHSLAEFSSGVYIIAGTTVAPNGSSDILVVKTNDAGTILWSKYLDYNGQDEFVGSLIVDNNQDIVLTGYTGVNGGNRPNKDLIVVKLDGSGNLVSEATIHDAQLEYSLYGFDLAETSTGDYLVVGMGTYGATANASKYGFVLRISHNLSTIAWGKQYLSIGGITPIYDSFNHILEVFDHPMGGELYLLTGSGTTTTGEMMATNDLINLSGNSVWPTGAVGNDWSPTYIGPGVMSLYQEVTNRFWVISYGPENTPILLILNGDGSGYGLWDLHNHFWGTEVDNINLINGMKWSDNSQDRILFSGYHIDPSVPPGTGWPMLVNLDLAPSPDNHWTQYYSFFDGADLQAVNFDFIVQPINYVHPTYSYMRNQMYYQPKTMVHDFLNPGSGTKFAEPSQSGLSIGASFLNTVNFGDIEDCIEVTSVGHGSPTTGTYPVNTNFISTSHAFAIIGYGVDTSSASITSSFICSSPLPKPFMGTNEPIDSKIKIHPNPVSDHLYISGLSNMVNGEIILYNMQGGKVLSKPYEENSDEMQLEVSNLQNGIYFLKIFDLGKNIFMGRVVKK